MIIDITCSITSTKSAANQTFFVPVDVLVNTENLRKAITFGLLAEKIDFLDANGNSISSAFLAENKNGLVLKPVHLCNLNNIKPEIVKASKKIGVSFDDFLSYGYYLYNLAQTNQLFLIEDGEMIEVVLAL